MPPPRRACAGWAARWTRIGTVTDLLTPRARRTTAASGDGAKPRPVVLAAVLAGLSSSALTLGVCMALGLAGWFAADAGRYGDTRDAITVGAYAWLMGQGAGIVVGGTAVTLLPLGLTLLVGCVAFRSGRRALVRGGADLRGVVTGGLVMAAVQAAVALVTAVVASRAVAETDPLRSLAGSFVLVLLTGTAGMLAGAGPSVRQPDPIPGWVRPVVTAAVGVVMLVLAASALLVGASLLSSFGEAANVLSGLHADGPGAASYALVVVALVPNAVLFGAAYLLGPGFLVGTGTLVSPTVVMVGPVPAFPLLAALPGDGPTPSWTAWLVGVPVLLAVVGGFLAGRRFRVDRYEAAAARGLGAGLLAALAVTGLAALSGGAAGPGRMADVGPPLGDTLVAAAVALGPGALVGALAACRWTCRRPSDEAAPAVPSGAR